MNKRFSDSLPASVFDIVPYKAGKTIDQVCTELELSDLTKMSSNENPLGTSPQVLAALANLDDLNLHLYPDANTVDLRQAIGTYLGVMPDAIVCGNGSNEILEIAATLTLRPGRKAVYSEHAFIVYHLATHARGAKPIVVPALNFGHDLDAMAKACQDPDVGIVFIANPNNPTGTWHPPEAIANFVRQVPPQVLIILDEAYHEYVTDGPGETLSLLAKHPNLMITRTFSKIHGLAGLRIGYGIASEELLGLFNRVRQPFNASTVAQIAARAALLDNKFIALSRRTNADGMMQLMAGLANQGYVTLPSQANFIAFNAGDAQGVFDALLRGGVIVRQLEEYGLPGWLRATIGSMQQNNKLLKALPARKR